MSLVYKLLSKIQPVKKLGTIIINRKIDVEHEVVFTVICHSFTQFSQSKYFKYSNYHANFKECISH